MRYIGPHFLLETRKSFARAFGARADDLGSDVKELQWRAVPRERRTHTANAVVQK